VSGDVPTTYRTAGALTPTSVPDDIAEGLARLRHRVIPFGDPVVWFPEVTSTNDAALRLADQGAPEGTLVGADMQTAGRGRHGRQWVSPSGAGVYLSLVLRPPQGGAGLLTLAAGVAAAEGIREATGLVVTLKWPNDVYVGTRKLAGILAEAGTSGPGVNFVVLGVGINLMPAAYPPEIAGRVTSLECELARPVDRGLVVAAFLAGLAERYRPRTDGARDRVITDWRMYGSGMFGRIVECTVGGRTISAVAEDINDEGALVVRTENERLTVTSGQVTWQ
jgi:BirA family biotin operon repressor/biotin-[acetyl-CoA-carboxylase] ligase